MTISRTVLFLFFSLFLFVGCDESNDTSIIDSEITELPDLTALDTTNLEADTLGSTDPTLETNTEMEETGSFFSRSFLEIIGVLVTGIIAFFVGRGKNGDDGSEIIGKLNLAISTLEETVKNLRTALTDAEEKVKLLTSDNTDLRSQLDAMTKSRDFFEKRDIAKAALIQKLDIDLAEIESDLEKIKDLTVDELVEQLKQKGITEQMLNELQFKGAEPTAIKKYIEDNGVEKLTEVVNLLVGYGQQIYAVKISEKIKEIFSA